MSPTTPPRAGQPRLLTVDEVAALLRVSKTSVYRLVEHRVLPFYRLPGSLRFAEEDVQAYLAARRVAAMGDPPPEQL